MLLKDRFLKKMLFKEQIAFDFFPKLIGSFFFFTLIENNFRVFKVTVYYGLWSADG